MARQIVLLRGINLGSTNWISMPELRDALEGAGGRRPDTSERKHRSCRAPLAADRVRRTVEELIADEFGLEIAVVVRTRAQLASVVRRNPLDDVATDPKRYQVRLHSPRSSLRRPFELEAAVESEALVVSGGGIFALAPGGRGAVEAVGHARGDGPRRDRDRAQLDDRHQAARLADD
jgi:uncharacterized protein (DUF1697 family)